MSPSELTSFRKEIFNSQIQTVFRSRSSFSTQFFKAQIRSEAKENARDVRSHISFQKPISHSDLAQGPTFGVGIPPGGTPCGTPAICHLWWWRIVTERHTWWKSIRKDEMTLSSRTYSRRNMRCTARWRSTSCITRCWCQRGSP